MNGLLKRLAVASTLAALAALTVGSATAGAAVIPNCVPKTNIEGIIDDSGSMAGNDSNNYRADLLEAIAFFNPDRTMGAVVFGSGASNLFGPFLVGPNFALIQSQLNLIASTSGGTDYDAAFTQANMHNPSANARIFLSDGQPNSPPNSNLWKSPKIPAYVVGFGTADFAVLNQIATETGGPSPFSITNSSQLRTVGQIINARINCETDPILVERQFGKQGQQKTIAFRPDGPTSEVLLSWPDLGNQFRTLFGRGGGPKASAAKKKKNRPPNVTSVRGTTYIALNLSRTGKKVKFKVQAKRLLGSQTVTAAIIP
jgi:hypothetical protein